MTEFSHATDSTLGTAAQAVLLLTCPARGLQQGIVPALYLLLQTRGQCLLQSGISLPSRATGFHVHALPGLLQGDMRCQAEEGNAVHQGGKKEGSCP